jgi:hypothetical protein
LRTLDHSVEILTGETETVARAKSSAETSETSETFKTQRIGDFREPRNSATVPAETSETSVARDRMEKILPFTRRERIIVPGVLAVQSRES